MADFEHRRVPTGLAWFEIHAIRGFRTTRDPGRRIRDGDAGNSTLPPVLSDTDGGAVDLTSGYRTSGRPRVPGPLVPARKGPPGAGRCEVPGVFVTDRAGVWRLPDPIVT